jgi:radical SAM superfamily enzyme YgiQ (UPF0313 family)
MGRGKKVTLMYPNLEWAEFTARTKWRIHPYNIALLAAMIEDEYDVSIIDANMDNLSKTEFATLVEDTQPDILGISTTTNEYTGSSLIAAEIAKKNSPGTKIIMGGVAVLSNHKPFIENSHVDGVVIGEGEYAFKELCNFLSGNGEFPEKGVLYKEDGKIRGSGRIDFIQDLDKLPLPAYHLIDFKKYTTQTQRETVDGPRAMPYAHIITSRGCPHNCCFCEVGSISGKKVRMRSVENIIKEIEWLIKEYGIKALIFDDDNLTVDKERAKRLFRTMIDRKYNLKWHDSAIAIATLDDEMLGLMKESGCQFLNVAIESGNPRVSREIVHKPINLESAKKTLKMIKSYGIGLAANFVIGFPGETWDEIRETIQFAENIDIDYVKIFIATPLPNTELYRIAREGGYLRKDFDFNKHLWADGWIDTDEFRHQDLKILRAYEWDRINFSDPVKRKKIARMMRITEERLNEIRKGTLKMSNP